MGKGKVGRISGVIHAGKEVGYDHNRGMTFRDKGDKAVDAVRRRRCLFLTAMPGGRR